MSGANIVAAILAIGAVVVMVKSDWDNAPFIAFCLIVASCEVAS